MLKELSELAAAEGDSSVLSVQAPESADVILQGYFEHILPNAPGHQYAKTFWHTQKAYLASMDSLCETYDAEQLALQQTPRWRCGLCNHKEVSGTQANDTLSPQCSLCMTTLTLDTKSDAGKDDFDSDIVRVILLYGIKNAVRASVLLGICYCMYASYCGMQ